MVLNKLLSNNHVKSDDIFNNRKAILSGGMINKLKNKIENKRHSKFKDFIELGKQKNEIY